MLVMGMPMFEKLLEARHSSCAPLNGYNLPEWVRISVGTMEETRI